MTEPMADQPNLQFGARQAGRDYRPRPAAFGVAVDEGGRIALVHITKPTNDYFDLPGGALEAGETPEIALIREFGEETGLLVHCGDLISKSGQYLITTGGEPANNLAHYFQVTVEAVDQALKIEQDHVLVWLTEEDALKRLRHDAHAWALACFIRKRAPAQKGAGS